MRDRFIKIVEWTKRFSKEIIIALVLAIIAAILLEYFHASIKQNKLNANLKAVAVVIAADKQGNILNQGSGIFISPNGKLVTNYHVIKGATLFRAKLPTGAYYDYKGVIGIDEDRDIAILHFDAQEVPYIKILGDSDNVKAGDKVVAIGAPLGYESTVSEGIVSHPSRTLNNQRFIQFTAPISSGSSGGGLFDESGKLIGATTRSINIPPELQKEVIAQNLNFAVPINIIKDVISGKKGITSFTEDSPEYYYLQATLANNNGKYDEAIEFFKKTISLNDRFVYAYIDLANVYYMKGLYDNEINLLKKAVELDPNNADVFYYLAGAFEDKELYDLAITAYNKALELSPEDKDTIYNLAILYIVQGEKNKAFELIPKLTKLNRGLGNELKALANRMK